MTEGGVPRHIAFIMDGNGRWARRQGLPRIRGHERGAEVLREITRHCCEIGVKEATFFCLSTENYRLRPRAEVRFLLRLLKDYLTGERRELAEGKIKLRSIGRIDEFPDEVIRELRRSEELSGEHEGMILRLALNYGSRGEILDAAGAIAREIARGERAADELESMDEREFARYLYDPQMSDPDLLIRTAGEMRVSNFLLWQISYAELWFTGCTWPEFSVARLEEALSSFRGRARKFGSLAPALTPEEGQT
ncbi:MAG: polyprenyl diphosphate synthase [Planctomycetota bacterium]